MKIFRPFSIVLFIALSINVFAVKKPVKEGSSILFNLGIGYSSIHSTPQKLEYTNFVTGLEFLLDKNDHFSINPNFIFSDGHTNVGRDNSIDFRNYETLGSFEVPLKYKVHLNTKNTFSFIMASGPFITSKDFSAKNRFVFGGLKLAAGLNIAPSNSRWQFELLPFDMQFILFNKTYKGGENFYNPGILFKYHLH